MRVRRPSPLLQYALVAFVGVSLALLAMILVRRLAQLDSIERLDRRAEQLGVAVQQSVDAKLQVLQAFQAFYAVNRMVNADEFRKFAVVTLLYHDDIHALQWIPITPVDRLDTFESFGRQLYGDSFFVKERDASGVFIPVGERDIYFPILYTEPLEGNEAVLGLDAAFEPTRRAVVEAAWLGGRPVASAPIRLVQEAGDQMAVLLYQPMYETAPPPPTEAERRETLVGIVPVVLRTGAFMSATLSSYDTSGFLIRLVDVAAEGTILYESSPYVMPAPHIAFQTTKPVSLANRSWQLHFAASNAYIESQITFSGIAAFGFVVVLDFLLIIYLWQRNRSDAALRGYAATLEATNKELDAYNHTIAHDLKHPLAIINGYAYLLADEQLSADGQRMLGAIPKVIDNMVEMIDGLLQLAKLRDASAAVTTVDMGQALARALERFDDDREKIRIEGELPPALGHSPWLVEVFANLINNALKYTPEGRTPDIRVRGVGDGRRARYEVSDNGIGIKPEDQQTIFEMFTRVDTADNYTIQKGLGIGLSIVKRAMQRLNGEVGVTSTPGVGSTFWFTLPAPPDDAAPRAKPPG